MAHLKDCVLVTLHGGGKKWSCDRGCPHSAPNPLLATDTEVEVAHALDCAVNRNAHPFKYCDCGATSGKGFTIPIPPVSPRASHVRVSSYHRDPNGGLIAIDHAGESYTVTQEGTALEPRFTLRRVTVLIALVP